MTTYNLGTVPTKEKAIEVIVGDESYIHPMITDAAKYMVMIFKKFPDIDKWRVNVSLETYYDKVWPSYGVALTFHENDIQAKIKADFIKDNLPEVW